MLENLNPAQLSAVTAPLGHTLVLAGAGSGKTRVLVSRMAWLIQTAGLRSDEILAVTFTNKAAGEMKQRLQAELSTSMHSLWVGTFHGLCHRLLRKHHQKARLSEQFQIIDTDDQSRLIKQIIQAKKLDEQLWPVKTVLSYINAQKEEGLRSSAVHAPSFGPQRTYWQLYEAYEKVCEQQGAVDFAELLLRTCELFRDEPEILQHYHQQFRAILVDEFQDTNHIQYTWIRLLAGDGTAVMVVGDDDQSIYGWRGARVENIQQFERDFPNTAVIRLEQNYRSTARILEAANALIDNNAGRMGKSLWTEGEKGEKITVYGAFNELEEARYVVDKMRLLIDKGMRPDEMACLYRSNAQSRVIEEALIRQGLPYRIYGGVRFFDRAEIKDAMAYLRLSLNPSDDLAFARIVNVPARGIGEKSLEPLRAHVAQYGGSLWQALVSLLEQGGVLTSRAEKALRGFESLLVRLQALMKNDLALEEQLESILAQSGLLAHYISSKSEASQTKVENLQEWVSAAKQFRDEGVKDEHLSWAAAFVAHVALEAGEMQSVEGEPSVHLMTIHAAKGLEFPAVFMVGVEEGIFPSRPSLGEEKKLEEERRLCYVGMTRAQSQLFMTYAEVRRLYGREEAHRPSRFLRELPEGLLNVARGSFAGSKPVQTISSSHLPFQIGQKVKHPTFGEGVVLAYEGGGAHLTVQVRFEQVGTKWLVVAYANLAVEF